MVVPIIVGPNLENHPYVGPLPNLHALYVPLPFVQCCPQLGHLIFMSHQCYNTKPLHFVHIVFTLFFNILIIIN